MTKVVLDLTISLDGYIAGPGDDVDRLHQWIFQDADTNPSMQGGTRFGSNQILEEAFRAIGAVIIGRRTFDLANDAGGDNPPFQVPCFVVTHRPRPAERRAATSFTFVESFDAAVDQAKAAAGDKNVSLMGASMAQQAIRGNVLDELLLHTVPVLLGDGIPLFANIGAQQRELEVTRVVQEEGVTHTWYSVRR